MVRSQSAFKVHISNRIIWKTLLCSKNKRCPVAMGRPPRCNRVESNHKQTTAFVTTPELRNFLHVLPYCYEFKVGMYNFKYKLLFENRSIMLPVGGLHLLWQVKFCLFDDRFRRYNWWLPDTGIDYCVL